MREHDIRVHWRYARRGAFRPINACLGSVSDTRTVEKESEMFLRTHFDHNGIIIALVDQDPSNGAKRRAVVIQILHVEQGRKLLQASLGGLSRGKRLA